MRPREQYVLPRLHQHRRCEYAVLPTPDDPAYWPLAACACRVEPYSAVLQSYVEGAVQGYLMAQPRRKPHEIRRSEVQRFLERLMEDDERFADTYVAFALLPRFQGQHIEDTRRQVLASIARQSKAMIQDIERTVQ